MIRYLLLLAALTLSPLAMAGDIAGFWKHADEPGWIEISLEQGTGVVVRNDKYPERVGRELLRGLQAEAGEAARWRGQVYADKFGEYRDALVSLPEPDRMEIKVKVGFISRSIEWVRVDEVPTAANQAGR